MFNLKKIGILIGFAGALGIGLAGSAFAASQMTDQEHDLGGALYTGDYAVQDGEVCVYCHTPHNATAGVGALWARSDSSATFTAYTSGSLDATVTNANAAGVETLACLSCHDGTVALDEALAGSSVKYMGLITDTTAVITDLEKQHPVGITIADDDDGIVAMVDDTLGGFPLFAALGDQMECATCHDVHGDGTLDYFLRASNTDSGLCTTCHTNK